MSAPAIQISYNDKEIRIFWDQDISGTYSFFNLYWSIASNMAGEATVSTNIPNVPDKYYSKNQIFFKFKRENIGLTNNNVFYVRLKGVSAAGVEDTVNVGPTKYIPSLPEELSNLRGTQIHGYDYTNRMWRKVSVDSDGQIGLGGYTGYASTGYQGDTGVTGETGLIGPAGLIGPTGYQGETGYGIQGATGLQGPAGAVGGSGTDNYVSRWNGTSNLQNSTAYIDDSGNLTLGDGIKLSNSRLTVYQSGYLYTFLAINTAGGTAGARILALSDDGAAIEEDDRLGYFYIGGTNDASHTIKMTTGLSSFATENWDSSKSGSNLKIEGTNTGSNSRSIWISIEDGNVSIPSLTASRAVTTDTSNNLSSSITTATEIGYVKGTTSNIQDQLNAKIGGSGTTNYVTKFTDGAAGIIGNSLIQDNGSKVYFGGSYLGYNNASDKGLQFNSANRVILQSTAEVYSDTRSNLKLFDDTPYDEGVGPGIAFYGKYNSSDTSTIFAAIKAYKTNNVDGDYGGELHIQTRSNGFLPYTKIKIEGDGSVFATSLSTDTGTDLIINASNEICKKSSARSFKKDIKKSVLDSTILQKFEIVDFEWKETNKKDTGFIADDLAELYPGIETYSEDKIQSWDTQKMLVLAVAEIQRLHKEIESLKIKLNKDV